MGCCGHTFPSVKKVQRAVEKNTEEFLAAAPKTKEEFLQFRDRRRPMDLRHGVCRNAVSLHGCVLCPLHPARHDGDDLRQGHCDINYFCATAKKFARWTKERQDAFMRFITDKKLDTFTYSLLMDKGKLLWEFEGKKTDSGTLLSRKQFKPPQQIAAKSNLKDGKHDADGGKEGEYICWQGIVGEQGVQHEENDKAEKVIDRKDIRYFSLLLVPERKKSGEIEQEE